MADLSQQDWEEQLAKDSNAIILDVRTEEEIEEGIIPNSGNRSGQACAIMKNLGFDTAYNLQGGFMNWEGETA